jgi:hypothetical protein
MMLYKFEKSNVLMLFQTWYQYLVIGRDKSYFVKSYSKSNNKYKQDEIIQMLDCFSDNIFANDEREFDYWKVKSSRLSLEFSMFGVLLYLSSRSVSFLLNIASCFELFFLDLSYGFL